ncbi:MAG: peptidylprolyl isomerase [bacterium]|nr:peptidylprolyl isomerase [bacterium]
MSRFYAVACVLVIFLCSCSKGPGSADLARVNGKSIKKAQFEAYLKFKRIAVKDDQHRQRLVDKFIEREALAAVIEKEPLLDQDLLAAELNEFRKEMVISRYYEKFLNDRVTEQAVQNYYNTHADSYRKRQAHGAHILIRTNVKMSEPERKAKLTTLQEAASKINAGEDFAGVAEAYSEDKISAKKGGDLGWLSEGAIDKRFSLVLFELEPGMVSDPIETPFGFHIIKLLEEAKEVKRPFNAVAGDIRYQLRNKAKKAEMERLLGKVNVRKRDDK